MIKNTIHICTSSKGGMSSVVNAYIKLFDLPQKNFWSSHDKGFLSSIFKTLRVCGRILFDKHLIYHLHTSHRGSVIRKLIISSFIRIKGKKYIIHLHGGGFKSFVLKSNITKRYTAYLLRHANAIVCNTNDMANFIAENISVNDKINIISNLCETITEQPIDLSQEKETIKFVFCGALVKDKGIFDLIEAMNIAKFKKKVILDIYGNGTLPQIKNSKINIKGWVAHDKYLNLLPNYDFLVLPSKYETFGLAFVEAMGIGLPVIGTFGPAIPEVVKNNNTGILVEFGDIQALAKALEQLVHDQSLRINLGKKAWLDVRKRFAPHNTLMKLEEMYQKI